MGGRQTRKEEEEISWKNSSISGRLHLGGALKRRICVIGSCGGIWQRRKETWKEGNTMRQWLEQSFLNISEPPNHLDGLLDP